MEDDIEQLLSDCETREGRLNDWERGFIDSVRRAFDETGFISKQRREKLNEVWERVTEKG